MNYIKWPIQLYYKTVIHDHIESVYLASHKFFVNEMVIFLFHIIFNKYKIRALFTEILFPLILGCDLTSNILILVNHFKYRSYQFYVLKSNFHLKPCPFK